MEIPLFPLHVVLLPGVPLPLHVFEPRYRALVADCLATGAPFGVVCLTSGSEVGLGRVAFARVGTLAEIREVARHPDGRLDIVTVGTARFRLDRVDPDPGPYLRGTVDLLAEVLGDPGRTVLLAARVRSRFVRYLGFLQPEESDGDEGPGREGTVEPGAPDAPAEAAPRPDAAGTALQRLEEIAARLAPVDDPVALGHVVSGLVQVDLPTRQRLLEAATAEDRLADLEGILGREIALLGRRLGPYAADPRLAILRRN